MSGVGRWRVVSVLGLAVAAGCGAPSASEPDATASTAQAVAQLHTTVASARATRSDAAALPEQTALAHERTTASGASLYAALPGRAARTVLHQQVNEAENLFFTEEGRLFVSGVEDIYEIERAADGTYTKTDHFDGDCVVEGIVRRQSYLYGVCWTLQPDLSTRAFLIAGELTDDPDFRIIAELDKDVVPNGMTVDPEGRVYVTYTTSVGQIVRLTFAEPLALKSKELWVSQLPNVNGIKYLDGALYVTLLSEALMGQFVRIAVRADGSAGKPETLYERWFAVLDDVLPFEDGFVISDFLKGTLIFWSRERGAYAETPAGTFFGPTSLAQGKPPMFDERQLIVAEKGNFLIRDETRGDLLSAYRLP